MWKSLFVSVCVTALTLSISRGEWSIVSTFGDAGELSKITDVYYTFTYNGNSSVENGKWVVNPGNETSDVEMYSLLHLGEDIAARGNPVTVYFEFTQPIVDNGSGGSRKAVTNAFWGLSNKGPQNVNQTNNRTNSFNAFQRII